MSFKHEDHAAWLERCSKPADPDAVPDPARTDGSGSS